MTLPVAEKTSSVAAGASSAILAAYLRRTGKSRQAHARARILLPGGTSRQAGYWEPYPLTFDSAEGVYLRDLDANRYFDLINNYTAMVHGHAYGPIVEAARRQAARGTGWAGGNLAQLELAGQIVERVAAVEQVRFTNSGTEAGALALNIARKITGRPKLLMARFGYHGSLMEFECGSFGHQGPVTLLATYNDLADFEGVLAEHGGDIAAVFLEPVLGSGGVVSGAPAFLKGVQAAARKAGALLVLDEVLTLRFGHRGVQGTLGLEPDLTMFGKLIGGGYPVGAVGGKRDLLRIFDPADLKLFHTGTFNANPVTMVAGGVALSHLTPEAIGRMEAGAQTLKDALTGAARKAGLPFSVNHHGSCLNLYFSDRPPHASMVRQDTALIGRFHLAAMNRGLFLAPRGMIALSTVMTPGQLDEIGQRAAAALADLAAEAEDLIPEPAG
ncbi:MAG: aminotransferase class III-fold pyridoxal phosphate-dependent enzyme [Proteobacteria bacterium]|nr:aminotransferase class III-fold pyridoxal phosphate-dependent enzyme [Pseudomonadota bacterium]